VTPRIEYDATTGNALYVGWALPGAAGSAASWRIAKPVFTGQELTGVVWADGNGNFDNVWDNRVSLSYSSNSALNFLVSPVAEIVPSGTRPGTSFSAGADIEFLPHAVEVNGLLLKKVTSSPGTGEYSIIATDLQIGFTISSGDFLLIRVQL
jgi:hypothetical protein